MLDDTADLLAALQQVGAPAPTMAAAALHKQTSQTIKQQQVPLRRSREHDNSSLSSAASSVPTTVSSAVFPQRPPAPCAAVAAPKQPPASVAMTGARIQVLPDGRIVRIPTPSAAAQVQTATTTTTTPVVSSLSPASLVIRSASSAPSLLVRQSSTSSTASSSNNHNMVSTPLSSSSSSTISPSASMLLFSSPAVAELKADLTKKFENQLKALWSESASSSGVVALADLASETVTAIVAACKGNPRDSKAKFVEILGFVLDEKSGPQLRAKLRSGALSAQSLATSTAHELLSEEMKETIAKEVTEHLLSRDQNYMMGLQSCSSNFFKCRHCGSKNTSYVEKQTSRGDEGSTCFITCMDCLKKMKIRA